MLEILNSKSFKDRFQYMEDLIKEYIYKCKMDKTQMERKSYQLKMLNENGSI